MISESISADIPPEIKFLNMFIPILMHFCILFLTGALQRYEAARHPTICKVINDVKLFPTVYTVANF